VFLEIGRVLVWCFLRMTLPKWWDTKLTVATAKKKSGKVTSHKKEPLPRTTSVIVICLQSQSPHLRVFLLFFFFSAPVLGLS
jgi:hypothetical protein